MKKRAETHKRNTVAAGVAVDLRTASEMKRLPMPGEALASRRPAPTPLPPATSTRWSQLPEHVTDTVYAEHPDWSLGEILVEARKRHQADELHGPGGAKERDPPSGSSSEPSA
jgi:hypothetical protein